MFRLLLLVLGIVFTLYGSEVKTKEVSVEKLINSGPGSYIIYGLFSSNAETGATLISDSKYTLNAWGCTYCNDYGKAIIDKRGSDITIKKFEPLSSLKTKAKVIRLNNNYATLKINNKQFTTPVTTERPSSNAYLVNNKWIIK